MTRIKTGVVRKVGLLPALAFALAALALFGGVALQTVPAVYASVMQLTDEMGFGGGEGEANLFGDGFELLEAGGQSGNRWHNSVVGAEKTYTVELDSNPNTPSSATLLSQVVKVVISVEDVTIDGMAYDGTALSTGTPNKAPQMLQVCIGACSTNADWSDETTIYFATTATTLESTSVAKWDVAQTIKVRARDDDFDDLGGEKKTRIKHAFTNYSSLVDQFLVVAVTDNDVRGIGLDATGIAGDSSTGWTQAVTEDSADTYIELDVDLESRPQIGPVKLTLTGAQDNKDPDDDFAWAKKPSGACSTVGDSVWQTSGSTVTLAYNKPADSNSGDPVYEWNAAQKICVRIDDDDVDHPNAESVVLTFTASDDDSTKETDYGARFLCGGDNLCNSRTVTSPGSGWTPTWSRSVIVPTSAVSATYTITITDSDSSGFTIQQSGTDVSGTGITVGE